MTLHDKHRMSKNIPRESHLNIDSNHERAPASMSMTFYEDNLSPSSSVPFVDVMEHRSPQPHHHQQHQHHQHQHHLSVLLHEPCPMYQSYSSSSSSSFSLPLPLPPPPPPPPPATSSSINFDRQELFDLVNVSTPFATPSTLSQESGRNDETGTTTTTATTTTPTTTMTTTPTIKCCSKETLTCLILTSLVIGLPVLIIVVLINLPRMTNKRDTRHEHYILLAFGFPFTLVLIFALVYGLHRLVWRIRTGPDDFKHLRKRMSFRRLSRRFARSGRRRCVHSIESPARHHHHQHRQSHQHHRASAAAAFDLATLEPEPKLYSLVTKVMFAQHDGQHG